MTKKTEHHHRPKPKPMYSRLFKNKRFKYVRFSKTSVIVFGLIFTSFGGYALYRAFAATTCLVSNRTSWALGGTDCSYGTLLNRGSSQFTCSQPLSNYGPLPIKVTWDFVDNRNPDWGDQGPVDLITGCSGDNDPDTIDLIAYVPGDGRTFGSSGGSAKFRTQPGPTNIQITGIFECGPLAPGSAAHQDTWQLQTGQPPSAGRNLTIVNGVSGNWNAGTSTCINAGGSPIYSNDNDVDIYGGEYVGCNAGFRGSGQTTPGNVVRDAKWRVGRVDGSDPRCAGLNSAGPCVDYSNFTFTNVTCGDWNSSQGRFVDQVINPSSSPPPPPPAPPPPPPPPPPPSSGSALPARLPESTGTVFYASTSGSDSNPGTQAAPWRTIQKALNTLTAGQKALIRAGTYTEDLRFDRTGTASAPITIEAYPGEKPVVDSAFVRRGLDIGSTGAYLRVKGLTFEESAFESGGHIDIYGHHIEITGTELRNGKGKGVYTDESSHHVHIIGNWIHDNATPGGGQQDHGIYLQGADHLVANNVIYNHPDGFGIQVYDQNSRSIIVSNTVTNSAHSGIVLGGSGGVDNIVVRNNIFAHNSKNGLDYDSTCPQSATVEHNVFWQNGSGGTTHIDSQSCSGVNLSGGNRLGANPAFVDQPNRNLHIQSTSQAISYALVDWSIPTDFDGTTRDASPDAGAYEFTSSPPPPPSPKVGDINGDGRVDISDLSILLTNWGSTTNTASDLNNNGVVDVFDLSILLSNYGT
jgi:hypothetical protein